MSLTVFFLIGGLLLVLQTTLLQELPGWMGRPDPLFVLIAFAALRLDIFQGAFLVLLFGLLQDIFSGIFLGLHPVVYLTVFFLLKAISKNLIYESVHQIPLVALSYLLTSCAIFLFASLLADGVSFDWSWRAVLLQTLAVAVIAMPFFCLYDWVATATRKKKPAGSSLQFHPGNRFKP